MAWRYKASKYKNAAPKFPKKESKRIVCHIHEVITPELNQKKKVGVFLPMNGPGKECILGLPVTDVGLSCGNHIKSSCVYVAFNTDLGGGGSLGYLPLSTKGRQSSSTPVIHAHSDLVTDFDFSLFDDYLLATGSQDSQVKIWLLPDEESATSISESVMSFSNHSRQIGNVLWHPTADGILAVTADSTLSVFDISGSEGKNVFSYPGHNDLVQSVSWKGEGSLLATSCKDKKLRVIDPRANQVVQEGSVHGNGKDSRVQWLGGKDFLLSTGFSMSRSREVCIWDPRKLQSSLNRIELGSSNGILMPLYDVDTNMTFLVGKGDSTLNYLEFSEKSPYLMSASVDHTEQVKGVCLVPKRAMNLMSAEVNRLLVLSKETITPIPYVVPRKSYHEFHEDIFPETRDGVPGSTAAQWLLNQGKEPPTVKLLPNKVLLHKDRRGAVFKDDPSPAAVNTTSSGPTSEQVDPLSQSANRDQETPKMSRGEPDSSSPTAQPCTTATTQDNETAPTPKTIKPFHKTRVSKFRYIKGKLEHPSKFFTNVRNVSKSMPGESNMFAANETRCVVPLDGAGGCLQVLEFSKAERLPDTGTLQIQNGSKVTDFAWDPFDDSRLVVGLDNAKINVWKIPEGGVSENMTEPKFSLRGHDDRIYFVSFHPLAAGIMATGSYDMTLRVWDLDQQTEVMSLQGHEDQIFSFGWSQSGCLCATACKDGKIRVFEPRKSTSAIREGAGPEGQRGARVLWMHQDKFLFVSGFNKQSRQEIRIYDSENLKCLESVELDTSPSIMVPFYDQDCSLLYLTCRGERIVKVFDVYEEEPYFNECAPLRLESVHQAASYLPKRLCNVREIEVAKGWRLTSNSVEAMTFIVPRVKPQYFQDDLYPDAVVTWQPALTASEWLAGKDAPAATVSLCPPDMQPLSQAPVEAPKPKKFESYNAETYKSDEQKKEELLSAIVGKLEISSEPMPQDLAEGVDDDEWDDY